MRLIDADTYCKEMQEYVFPITENNLMGAADAYYRCVHLLENAPTIDAVVLPKGKIGDCVKWNTGVSVKLFQIHSILICEDGIRYDLGDISPFVDHPKIMGILSQEEAEKILREHGREYDNY